MSAKRNGKLGVLGAIGVYVLPPPWRGRSAPYHAARAKEAPRNINAPASRARRASPGWRGMAYRRHAISEARYIAPKMRAQRSTCCRNISIKRRAGRRMRKAASSYHAETRLSRRRGRRPSHREESVIMYIIAMASSSANISFAMSNGAGANMLEIESVSIAGDTTAAAHMSPLRHLRRQASPSMASAELMSKRFIAGARMAARRKYHLATHRRAARAEGPVAAAHPPSRCRGGRPQGTKL